MIWEIDDQERVVEGVDAAGRPDPAYAAALGLVRAPFGRRSLAFACDVAIWIVLQLPLWLGAVPLLLKLLSGSVSTYGFVNHPDFVLSVIFASVSAFLSLVFLIVQWVLNGRKGVTAGKSVTGIRTVNVRTLERPGVGAILLRFLIVMAAGIVPAGTAVILASPTFDAGRRGRGWHDKATGVWLVDVRNGLNPYDEKRMRLARKKVKIEPLPERSELPSLATPRDPRAQPEYRPGNRISAGVLGVARPPEELPVIEPAPATMAQPQAPQAQFPQLLTPTPAPNAGVPGPLPAPQPAPQPQSAWQPPALLPPADAPPAPDAPATPAPSPRLAATAMRFELRLDTGDSIRVSEPILLGRNPDAADHPGARPIAVADASRSLSKTHMFVRPVDGGLEVVDWHSTNGSALISNGVEHALPPGVPVQAAEGDRIRLGDRLADVIRI
ncbi:hypothetical protein ASD56_11790 [Microbacterium sp. Root166]|uniref:RDD family protein n=1 Tax=Microbacterium sp. Root166 TaxID=1736478 RepID=UPI000701CD0D|nr:RDD family protein [Microbacterium sp. Root166]KQZ83022.1 hypothetical protein ASD56_11790 [Microbacterium sp. Root166]